MYSMGLVDLDALVWELYEFYLSMEDAAGRVMTFRSVKNADRTVKNADRMKRTQVCP